MKLYGLYTPTHEVLVREWFLATLQDDFDLQLAREQQIGPPDQHGYGTDAFNITTLRKVELTLGAITENWGDVFVVSDVDIQFFGPAEQNLRACIDDRDIVFQQNQANGEINAGFFVCRANERTRQLWSRVRDLMLERPEWNDQDALNHLMFRRVPRLVRALPQSHAAQRRLCAFARRGLPVHRIAHILPLFGNEFGIRWRYLPIEFFLKGLRTAGNWEPGQDLRIPKKIVMHHANFCIGVDAKVEQLREVSAVVTTRQMHTRALEQPLP